MGIKITKLKKRDNSPSVPGDGSVEIPLGMERAQGGRDRHNARHYANAMSPFFGGAKSVASQTEGEGGDGR